MEVPPSTFENIPDLGQVREDGVGGGDGLLHGDAAETEAPRVAGEQRGAESRGPARQDVLVEIVPDIEDLLLPKGNSTVKRFTGEYHGVLLTTEPTHAAKATRDAGAATVRILNARGCRPQYNAHVNC